MHTKSSLRFGLCMQAAVVAHLYSMKRRGLRRYFQNLKNQKLLEFLDFSGSEQSWFDFYHLHIDNVGLGNKSWRARKQHLDALFDLAGKVEAKLQHYPKDYQYWIGIDEKD